MAPNNQVMIRLLKLIMILENSRFVGWVTLNADKIFWACVCLNLFFKYGGVSGSNQYKSWRDETE